ncbi:hypothetical protein [Heyndrickxia camelliae]|uniref:Uncharacterized protein n=1 Tax=Heyndrickxia camelliae TaxID=1707093 RepID=A0A2N3LG53_9BACI|nr:hypothetical protein [Heyndrickxia camelliae]PKR83534.1 hypothetical protein CWO92_18385 [Heyndrickxia camelliae]
MKITIEYEGDCQLDKSSEETKINDSFGKSILSYKHEPTYELVLPKLANAKVTIEEDELHKHRVIENVTIKVDSKINQEELKQKLFDVVTNELKHLKLN